jgi:hypothetical protein
MEEMLNSGDQADLEDISRPIDFQVSGPAQTYVINIHDRFANADSRLVERLG